MSLGWGSTNSGPRSFEAGLSVAEKVLRGLNAGVDGFNRWSFLNRGDQDGQWQLVRTWDMEAKRYLDRAEPEPTPFYCYAMLTRFTAKSSEVLPSTLDFANAQEGPPRLFAAALRSPRGHLTLLLANRETTTSEIRIRWKSLDRERTFYAYELTEEKLLQHGFKLAAEPDQTAKSRQPEFVRTLPARSLTVFTTYHLKPDAPGITSETAR